MKISLGSKLVLSIVIVAIILSGTCIGISSIVFRNIMNDEYHITTEAMAATVAATVDGDEMQVITDKVMEIYRNSETKVDNTRWNEPEFEEYSAQFLSLMDDEAYKDIQVALRKIQDVSEADCVYTLCILPDEETSVYIVDGAYGEDTVPPGCFDYLDEESYELMGNFEQGLPSYTTNTEEYGWMVTACAPIRNSKGELVCFAAVDIGMNDVVATENRFILRLSAVLLLLIVIICVAAIVFVKRRIVKPINMLSEAAGQYGQDQSSHHEFSNLKIRTGDELEVLLGSMVQMEKDIENYIQNLTQTKEQLTSARKQADDMQKQAHLDSLTGIRNRLAYDKETAILDRELESDDQTAFGIAMIDLNFLKVINDTYGHECGNATIISLSKLICDVFVHSPVFRIGGDEFAVILRNNDYDKIESLQQEFNDRLEAMQNDDSLQAWEKLSAAFGYALYDRDIDNNADDVFKRADRNMYERKKAMKGERK